MPVLHTAKGTFHYEVAGPPGAPVLLFSNSLGTDLSMWGPQAQTLAQEFRVLRYDGRGQGQSPVTPGPYTIETLADDVLTLLKKLDIAKVHFCGLSMGGMVGMSLAMRSPERLEKLILCNTAPKIGAPEIWDARITAVRSGGMAAVVDGVLERWFTSDFRKSSSESIQKTREMLLRSPVEGYVACCSAVRDMDARQSIGSIRIPTLIISGVHDPVTPPHDGRFMAAKIAGSVYKELPAAHLSNIEAAEAFTMEVRQFLKA
jgi:3-oxoadipate enol-lactonase